MNALTDNSDTAERTGVESTCRMGIKAASQYLQGVSTQTLYRYRHQNIGPRSYTIGTRVFYDVEDLDAWVAEQKATSSRGGA